MNWEERIEVNSQVLGGKPVIRGTRLAVEFILELLTNGWTENQIVENYPGITGDDISACLHHAADEDITYDPVPPKIVGTMRVELRDGGRLQPRPYRTDD